MIVMIYEQFQVAYNLLLLSLFLAADLLLVVSAHIHTKVIHRETLSNASRQRHKGIYLMFVNSKVLQEMFT